MPVMAEPTASAVFLPTLSSSVCLDALSTRETSAPPVPLPLIRVRLPVADPFLRLNRRRTLGDVHPARDVAAARMGAALPVRLPAAAAEMPPETAAGLPVGVDALVDPLTPRHRLALLAEAPADLLGARPSASRSSAMRHGSGVILRAADEAALRRLSDLRWACLWR